jgi:two-component system, LytTR family, response regulator
MNQTKTYRCMVIDDESHAIELLSDYIQAMPQLQLAKTFSDPIAALMDSNGGETYDFIFMDIDMPKLSGIELAKSLRLQTSFLIFTTAHPKYAVEAFDVRADHFLLKPIGMNKFAMTIDLLLKGKESTTVQASSTDHTFFIKSDQKNKMIKICPEDIICIEGLKNYVVINTTCQKHIAYLTMKEIEEALHPTGGFIRVHKSYIVAKKYIERVEGRAIRLKNNLEAPIGETYRQDFQDYILKKALLSNR